jgi:creatinine amidohydrolase/Fe(II)-dependent formamide hydrolase-like protein
MNFADLNWMQIEAYLAEDDRLIVVIGATEQHLSALLPIFWTTRVRSACG